MSRTSPYDHWMLRRFGLLAMTTAVKRRFRCHKRSTSADAIDVSPLLAGAAKTVASARYCWLATATDAGPPRLRPMGRVLGDPGEDEWTIRFLTDGRSHKVGEMRRANEVAIVFQHDPDLAFVTLIGKAALHDKHSEVRSAGNAPTTSTFRLKRTGRTPSSSRSGSRAWSSGSAASRPSRSDCARPRSSGTPAAAGG